MSKIILEDFFDDIDINDDVLLSNENDDDLLKHFSINFELKQGCTLTKQQVSKFAYILKYFFDYDNFIIKDQYNFKITMQSIPNLTYKEIEKLHSILNKFKFLLIYFNDNSSIAIYVLVPKYTFISFFLLQLYDKFDIKDMSKFIGIDFKLNEIKELSKVFSDNGLDDTSIEIHLYNYNFIYNNINDVNNDMVSMFDEFEPDSLYYEQSNELLYSFTLHVDQFLDRDSYLFCDCNLLDIKVYVDFRLPDYVNISFVNNSLSLEEKKSILDECCKTLKPYLK